MPTRQRLFAAIVCASVSAVALYAQQSRLSGALDGGSRVTLTGHVPRRIRAATDRGAVAGNFQLPSMMLVLKPSASQQASLTTLLQQQQDPTSANYHKWLTPAEFANQFGVSQSDLAQIESWLQSQGFSIWKSANSRNWIGFSGTAAQAQTAFQTEIHQYRVSGVTHFANSTDPSVPAALAPLVTEIRGLNDFHPKPQIRTPTAKYTCPSNVTTNTCAPGMHTLVPDDIATIYDIAPLYAAGINGTGQSLAVMGQTDIQTSDINSFRSKYGLPTINLQLVLAQARHPGISSGDLPEADLDIEWSGAVARNATIYYVYSDDVFNSAFYAVEEKTAPVMTISYGTCEPSDLIDLPSIQQLAQQANAEGITWFAASGDVGAAACDDDGEATVAQAGLAVDWPASIPEITGMGGNEFNEQGGSYWSSTNSSTGASALGYIPEMAWNDTAIDGVLMAGGGGASVVFSQPIWQTGPGVPTDGVRHSPDLAFAASADHDGYNVITGGEPGIFGGTSVSAPIMAGVTTLLNQYLVQQNGGTAGLGNINPTLYRLAQTSPTVFHDVTTGSNVVPCALNTPNCTSGSFGYLAQSGYDSATGLGSVDVNKFVTGWTAVQPPPGAAVVPSISTNNCLEYAQYQECPSNPLFEYNNQWQFQVTLTEEAGVAATLTSFTIAGTSYTAQISTLFGSASIPARGSITATITLTTMPATNPVVFAFGGTDANNNSWSTQMSVTFEATQTALTVAGVSNAASGQTLYAPGMLMAIYGTGLGTAVQQAQAIPLPQYLMGFEASINGYPCPLWYVSPNQVNVQIPYETTPGPATLTVSNPFQEVNYVFTVSANAPGIFMFSDGSVNPSRTATRGQETFLYITGDGQVNPSLADGNTPASGTALNKLPKPVAAVTVTVGGVAVPSLDFIGITPGLVGVTQVNFTIPSNVPTGPQPVVVTVGTQPSNTATMTIQ
jgi:uncharacterized protein (TIGR03437 family)